MKSHALIIEASPKMFALLFGGIAVLSSCGCAHDSAGAAWYKPSAFTLGVTAPDLIAAPPISSTHSSTRHNGPLSTVGGIASVTFPLFPTPTKPQGPYSVPVPAVASTPTPPLENVQ